MDGDRREEEGEEEEELGKAAALPDVGFDPGVHVSPYELFRRLREGRPPRLWALPDAGPLIMAGALPYPATSPEHAPDEQAVLLDRDGEAALAEVHRLHAAHPALTGRVRALYGGLALYDFCLDPRVVGEERFISSSSL
jgi:hypothetical protein